MQDDLTARNSDFDESRQRREAFIKDIRTCLHTCGQFSVTN